MRYYSGVHQTPMENFIRTYENVITDDGCDHLISRIDSTTEYSGGNRICGLDIKDKQLPLDPYFPIMSQEINQDIIDNVFTHYCKDFHTYPEEVIGYQDHYFYRKHLLLKDFIPGTVRILVGLMLLDGLPGWFILMTLKMEERLNSYIKVLELNQRKEWQSFGQEHIHIFIGETHL